MPAEKLIIDQKARKDIKKLDKKLQAKLVYALNQLQLNPLLGEKLHGELKSYSKFRLGDYRVIYTYHIQTKTLTILNVEHRQGVYK